MQKRFRGLGVAMVTPFQEGGDVDYKSLEKLTEHLIGNGSDFLVVQGTTGETPVLSNEEKQKTLDFVLQINKGRLPIVLGVGGNNTREVCKEFQTIPKGVDGILSASPHYNKPNQAGIYAHYSALAECTDLPIILYNVPGRTASNMAADTTLNLAEDFDNIIAIKEASGNLEQVSEILKYKPLGFDVLSGDDALTLPMLALGAEGVISVVGNAFPKEFSNMIKAYFEGKMNLAQSIHFRLFDLIQALFADGNPAGIKEVLKTLNICSTHLRLPLVEVNEDLKKHLYNCLVESQLV
ncbi:MAG: 4-hydroxy-tetrahydrodipicolinate synthase [Sphingobacteriales bacterium]|jgi:4-hydroxy-tetrahydrodipicolinate synthase